MQISVAKQPKSMVRVSIELSADEMQPFLDRAAEALGKGYSFLVFPEGTRGSGEELAPFKSGIYHLACRRPDVELVPAYLENLNRILPKGEVLPVPLLSSATFGPPITIAPHESKRDFLDRTRAAVIQLKPV